MEKTKFELIRVQELTSKQREEVDVFIMKKSSNGEFINTLKFLDYHSKDRFHDDSVVVLDAGSKTVRAVMMAAWENGEDSTIVSHPGTTFAGPIIDRRFHIEVIEKTLDIMLSYYENKYQKIILKLPPINYSYQPCGVVDFFLLRRGYIYGMAGLANIIHISGIETEEDILQIFISKRRNQVRKVIKEGLFKFQEEKTIKPLIWENMNHNLELRFQAKTTHTFEEICDLKLRCGDNILPFYVNTKDDSYGAFALAFVFKNIFHTQYLDLNYNLSGKYPNLYLIMKLIKKACEMGCDYFSFGASTENDGRILNYGLYNYKAEYGGGDIILPLYTKKVDKSNL